MKKILVYLSCVLILGACMKNDPILENRMDNGIVKIYDSANKEFFTGYIETTKLNKQGVTYVSEKGNVKNGLKDGEYVTYWDNGKINAKINYTDGILNGTSFLFNVFGELLNMSTFVNGELEGPYIEVKKLDNLKIVGSIENNRFVGLYKEYWDYPNYKGLHKSVTYTYEGKRDGIYEEYDREGQLWERTFYEDGVIHGFREMYLYIGNQKIIDFRGYYYEGKKEGTILRNGYSEKFPLIGLDDYKEFMKYAFTANEKHFGKEGYVVEYYTNGNIKSYRSEGDYSSLTYDEGFDIIDLMSDIKKQSNYVKKAKTAEELDKVENYIKSDMYAYILGWLLSENLNEKQKKNLKIVGDAMRSCLVDIYVRRRTIAVG